MMLKLNLHCYQSLLLFLCLLSSSIFARDHGNPANELVEIINENRTAHKLPKLYDSPGLGCMALQYIQQCTGNCSVNGTVNCHPPEDDMTEIFAPNCGVELPTIDIIYGPLIGCQMGDLDPAQALSDVLIHHDKNTTSLMHEKNATEVGVGLSRLHKGEFFWCVLFSSGQTNSTFVLEGGKGIQQKRGCFSGKDVQCSAGKRMCLVSRRFSVAVLTFFFCLVTGFMM